MPVFTCTDCGAEFSLSEQVLDRYPGWTPRRCLDCKNGGGSAGSRATARQENPSDAGTNGDPQTGIFTDGSSVPNPGPGGWGAVYVVDGDVVAESSGSDPDTTNNRMELAALIAAADLAPKGEAVTVYSDSNLAVRTINEWAAGWERNGWRRKSGPVENLDLVKEAYAAYRDRPELSLAWIKAHVGYTWNEYADELANRARENQS